MPCSTCRTWLLAAALMFAALPAVADLPMLRDEPRGGTVPDPGLESLAWLAGRWTGEALGGVAEDVWAPPLGGQMVGLFRLVADGEVRFYELINLLYVDGRLTMRLKHFSAELHGWETKDETVDFPLVDHEEDVWYFSGLTIERRGQDAMTMHVRMGGEGQTSTVPFAYTRVER